MKKVPFKERTKINGIEHQNRAYCEKKTITTS